MARRRCCSKGTGLHASRWERIISRQLYQKGSDPCEVRWQSNGNESGIDRCHQGMTGTCHAESMALHEGAGFACSY